MWNFINKTKLSVCKRADNIFDFPVLIPDVTHGGKARVLFIESLNKR